MISSALSFYLGCEAGRSAVPLGRLGTTVFIQLFLSDLVIVYNHEITKERAVPQDNIPLAYIIFCAFYALIIQKHVHVCIIS